MMYTYRICLIPELGEELENLLNELGQDGWRLVEMRQHTFIMEKPVEIEAQPWRPRSLAWDPQ